MLFTYLGEGEGRGEGGQMGGESVGGGAEQSKMTTSLGNKNFTQIVKIEAGILNCTLHSS